LVCFRVFFLSGIVFGTAFAGAEPANMLSLQEGALPVQAPASYGGWYPENLLDESPETGWACETGQISDNVFVFELAEETTLDRFEFDTAAIDTEKSGAKDVLVDVSTTSAQAGYAPVLQATLTEKADMQRFPAAEKKPARWVRLTISNNYGSLEWTELFAFRGFGEKPAPTNPGNISGTYDSSYSQFHVLQQGTALSGCYEYKEGLMEGSIEGRVMKLTWREGKDRGPAVMVFAKDGKSFQGYFWHQGNEKGAPAGNWEGKKVSAEVGGCLHWSGSVGGELKKKLSGEKRARLYGILFDFNSAAIKPESKPVLEEVLSVLKNESTWNLTIEGHTDAIGSDDQNQTLSQKRADSVKAYLVAGGIDPGRLKTAGLGESKPVADNATELGRAQNRRVELVRE
jgi:outer membrane protein OmpA-like peptidoglycan-associated protein